MELNMVEVQSLFIELYYQNSPSISINSIFSRNNCIYIYFSNSLWICDEIIPNYNIPTEMSNTKSSSKNIKTYELTSIIATFTMLMKWLK